MKQSISSGRALKPRMHSLIDISCFIYASQSLAHSQMCGYQLTCISNHIYTGAQHSHYNLTPHSITPSTTPIPGVFVFWYC